MEKVPCGPTEWMSPLVVVPTPDGDIRICIDMRRSNETIERERHPIPTIEEVLHDLNGSTVLSRLSAVAWGGAGGARAPPIIWQTPKNIY